MDNRFPALNFPKFDLNISQTHGRLVIYDSLRKKNLVLTPEEWVRQHLMHYLTETLRYPKGLTELERKVNINGRPRRFDLSVMNPQGEYILLAECKAPSVELSPETVYQTVAYGKMLNPRLYLLTNGLRHICFRATETGVSFLEEIPAYK